jgi:CubicO group peptidase (beta-lactamase class C family)
LPMISEALVTTPAAMLLADDGRLLFDAAVRDYVPEFLGPGKDSVLVQDLLFHSSGLPEFLPVEETEGPEALLKAVCAIPLNPTPDMGTLRSDPDLVLLAEIGSRAAGRPIGRLLAESLYDPLRSTLSRSETNSNSPDSTITSRLQQKPDLAGTTHTIAALAQMLLNRGLYNHQRYLRAETVDRFASARRTSQGAQGLGWIKSTPADWRGRLFPRASYGSMDAGHLFLWIDPTRQMFIVLLTDPGTEPHNPQKIDDARRELCESVVHELAEAERKAR